MRFHGVLIEVGGLGVLLAGPSGVGKSECALELVARGHRLVADDAVELTREGESLVGRAAPAVRDHIEVRGLGILDVRNLYGRDAVAESAVVGLLCRLDPNLESLDRTGLDRAEETLQGVAVPVVTLSAQLRMGASLATVVDAAARDTRSRRDGTHGAQRFDARLQRLSRGGE